MSDTPRTDALREMLRNSIGKRQATGAEAGLLTAHEKLERENAELRAKLATARNDALEQAARISERSHWKDQCAAAIRAAKGA